MLLLVWCFSTPPCDACDLSMSETAQLDPEPRSPEPRTESNQLRLCLLTHMWLLFIACRVCVALSGIALAGIALAVIALDGPSFSYPLPGRPPLPRLCRRAALPRSRCACAFSHVAAFLLRAGSASRSPVSIALAGIALAVITLDGPSFSYPLPGRPPPSAPLPSRRVASLSTGCGFGSVGVAASLSSCAAFAPPLSPSRFPRPPSRGPAPLPGSAASNEWTQQAVML
jgi:hypothetical protein